MAHFQVNFEALAQALIRIPRHDCEFSQQPPGVGLHGGNHPTVGKLLTAEGGRRTATPFISWRMNPTGSWFTAGWRCPLSPTCMTIPSSATLSPSLCACRASVLATSTSPTGRQAVRRCSPLSRGPPAPVATSARPACGSGSSPGASSCRRTSRRTMKTARCSRMS